MNHSKRNLTFFILLATLAWLIPLSSSSSPTRTKSKNGNKYVQNACRVTQFPNLCIHSLAPFSSTAKNNPTTWARAGVSVTIREAKSVSRYLVQMKRRNPFKGRSNYALQDCIETLQDTLDNLHKSLGVLRKVNGQEFNTQMEDVITWLSAALTDEDTCLDGFSDRRNRVVKMLFRRVLNVTQFTSNALALVNSLATTGPRI